ncbi:hypothetical protein JW758_00045 [Candidatus Peregrinibacteria bacterium]|nr:hypothetical protein [Candidatus Peregrinibacteria bacterium]
MIKTLSKFFSSLAIIGLIFINSVPFALAQNSFNSPLDTIKDKLNEGEDGVELVDFSESKWGKLPNRLIEGLSIDYEEGGLGEIAKDFTDSAEGYDIQGLRDYITNDLTFYDEAGEVAPANEEEIQLIINEVNLYRFSGERQIRDTIRSVAKVMRNLIGSLAILWIIISGVRMIFAQGEESVITEQKQSITYAVIGLAAILLIERMIDIIYGPAGVQQTVLDTGAEAAFSTEIYGIINFIRVIIASVAILFIIISGFKSITAAGEEEQITKQRKAVVWIIVGVALLGIDQIIVNNIFGTPVKEQSDQILASNVTAIINTIGTVIQFVLGFVGLIALAALIYGAGMMVANYGNDEMVEKSKKLIKSALIGIIVIISAYTLVATLIVFK